MKHYLALILSVLLAVSLLASCDGNGGETSSAPTPSESLLPTASTDPTLPTDPSMPTATDPTSGVATQPSAPMVTDPSITTEPIATKPTYTITQPTTAPTTQTPVITQAPPILTQAPGVTTAPSATQPTASSSTVTDAPTTLPTQYQDAVAPLANSKYLLTANKKLNVAFLGGSITAGVGASDGCSWREKTVDWFKKTYPGTNITEIEAARGGTGSHYGKFRLDEQVLQYKPDLVFVEFVVNDKLDGLNISAAQSTANMEAIVRKCYASNPNVDIVFVYTTTVSMGAVTANTQINAFNTVAERYGIEVVYAGAAMGKTGEPLSSLFTADGTHPNDKGYAVMATEVTNRLTELFGKAGNPAKTINHIVPPALTENLNTNTKTYYADELKKQNASLAVTEQVFGKTPLNCIEMKAGESFTFTFTGDSIGIYWRSRSQGGANLICTLDSGAQIARKTAGTVITGHTLTLFDGLAKGKHTLTFTNTGTNALHIPMVFVTE